MRLRLARPVVALPIAVPCPPKAFDATRKDPGTPSALVWTVPKLSDMITSTAPVVAEPPCPSKPPLPPTAVAAITDSPNRLKPLSTRLTAIWPLTASPPTPSKSVASPPAATGVICNAPPLRLELVRLTVTLAERAKPPAALPVPPSVVPPMNSCANPLASGSRLMSASLAVNRRSPLCALPPITPLPPVVWSKTANSPIALSVPEMISTEFAPPTALPPLPPPEPFPPTPPAPPPTICKVASPPLVMRIMRVPPMALPPVTLLVELALDPPSA